MSTRPETERAAAARALWAVLTRGHTTDETLPSLPSPLSRELLFGTLRRYLTLTRLVDGNLARPLRPKDQDLKCLMLVGAYQLMHSRIPDHAAIHTTVAACRDLGKPWARGLVNGVLRNLQRKPKQSFVPADDYPGWIADLVRRDLPGEADAVLAACLERAPMALRINVARINAEAFLAQLAAAGIESERAFTDEQLILRRPMPALELPGFAEGLVSVQDAGAGFAPTLLSPRPGQRLLDTCAAPGGKLFHLMETQPALAEAVALEASPKRAAHLLAESQRLGHAPTIREADARALEWWDGQPFDVILVDAPCTGSGTLRRHPDIKLLRQPEDLPRYTVSQRALLESAWRTLRPGGSLLYCTCSLFSAENDQVIEHFLAQTEDATGQSISLPTGNQTRHGWQLLPTDPRTDGFYYALLTKG